MTMPRFSTIIYWVLALIFTLGLISAVGSLFEPLYPIHWRFPLWWAALLGTHILRYPLVPAIWFAFLFDAFDGFMTFMYATQASPELFFIMLPILILALTILVWAQGQYHPLSRSKGDTHV